MDFPSDDFIRVNFKHHVLELWVSFGAPSKPFVNALSSFVEETIMIIWGGRLSRRRNQGRHFSFFQGGSSILTDFLAGGKM